MNNKMASRIITIQIMEASNQNYYKKMIFNLCIVHNIQLIKVIKTIDISFLNQFQMFIYLILKYY
jgi:hypothetical protein